MEPISITLTGVRGVSRTKDPADPNSYEITAIVPVSEIARVVATGPFANLREGCSSDPTANKRSPVAKAIINQLVEGPTEFYQNNNGITVIADEAAAEAHGSSGTLRIVYSNPAFLRAYRDDPNNTQQIRGVGNGGTTTGAIAEAISEGVYPNDKGPAFVRLIVKCGTFDRDQVHDMVEALNTAKQVDSFSSANYAGLFDPIREFLQSSAAEIDGRHFPAVAYFFGDAGEYTIQELVQLLVLFARTDAEGDLVPHNAYAGVDNCLKYYKLPEGNKACLRMLPMLAKIVYLYEFIIANARTAYNSKGSFHGLALFAGMNAPPTELPFSHLEKTIRVNNGWVFPLLAAFASVVADNKKSWTVNPQELFVELAPKMIKQLNASFDELGGARGGKISSLGRTAGVYKLQQQLVDQKMFRRR